MPRPVARGLIASLALQSAPPASRWRRNTIKSLCEGSRPVDHTELIEEYLRGPHLLRVAIEGMSAEEIDAAPIAGKWSTRQIICHLADFEPVYADRIKRCLAEENPPLAGGDPDLFAERLAYEARDIEEELQLIESVRKHLARILKALPADSFARAGTHSVDGPLSVETLLWRITGHVPHHIKFIEEKRHVLSS